MLLLHALLRTRAPPARGGIAVFFVAVVDAIVFSVAVQLDVYAATVFATELVRLAAFDVATQRGRFVGTVAALIDPVAHRASRNASVVVAAHTIGRAVCFHAVRFFFV